MLHIIIILHCMEARMSFSATSLPGSGTRSALWATRTLRLSALRWSGISRIRFNHYSNRIPRSSNSCFVLYLVV